MSEYWLNSYNLNSFNLFSNLLYEAYCCCLLLFVFNVIKFSIFINNGELQLTIHGRSDKSS